MTVLRILRYPATGLRVVAAPVAEFDASLRDLAADLLDTLRSVSGLGITASHVGIARRLVALQLAGPDSARMYVNPVIRWASAERTLHQEGSVSMPGVAEQVERAAQVRVDYQDLMGDPYSELAEGLLAVCHQHEIDQLDGKFWIERLSRLKRERLIRRHDKLRRGG